MVRGLLVRPGMVTPLEPSIDNSVPWAETEAAKAATRKDWERILNEGFGVVVVVKLERIGE